VKFLLDTQLIYWWLVAPKLLPTQARCLIEDSIDPVMVSVVSEWELAIKVSNKKMGLNMPVFSKGIDDCGFDRLGIAPLHTHAVAQLPLFDDHKDPFDRLLIAQSLSEPLILLTTDEKLARYGTTVRVV
jgi:PIN domain nuclease of toxin-antitoxin system